MIPCTIKHANGKWVAGYYFIQVIMKEDEEYGVVVDAKGFMLLMFMSMIQLDMTYLEEDDDV